MEYFFNKRGFKDFFNQLYNFYIMNVHLLDKKGVCLHIVKGFQVLLSNTNNSV